ncbi:hypothetical protein LCGC14_0303360 [marine sediment metagenome]|uniref:Uncharacterized protein n=1 Tax=marine sediment metagenome TaxID=412755 RepID=A0A0F9TPS4_9ZZZZ
MPLFGYGEHKKKEPRQKSQLSLFHREEINKKPKTDTKNMVIESTDTFTGDSAFDMAVQRRLFGLKVTVEHHNGPKKVKHMQRGAIQSTYKLRIKRDKNLKNLSEDEKKEIARLDGVIKETYAQADRKRLSEDRRGTIPKHRSIDKHFRRSVKDKKFTPDVDAIRGEKAEKIKKMKKKGIKFSRKNK